MSYSENIGGQTVEVFIGYKHARDGKTGLGRGWRIATMNWYDSGDRVVCSIARLSPGETPDPAFAAKCCLQRLHAFAEGKAVAIESLDKIDRNTTLVSLTKEDFKTFIHSDVLREHYLRRQKNQRAKK